MRLFAAGMLLPATCCLITDAFTVNGYQLDVSGCSIGYRVSGIGNQWSGNQKSAGGILRVSNSAVPERSNGISLPLPMRE